MSGQADIKKAVATLAVDRFVHSGMRLGLGTGSTAIWAVRRVAEKIANGTLSGIRAVATSLQSEIEARALGIPLGGLGDAGMGAGLDLTIDGADEIDPEGRLIKGGGGALLLEKVVAYASESFVVVADSSKLSARLCDSFAIPVEIVPPALGPVSRTLEEMGAEVSLRTAVKKAGPVVTDLGNLLLDVRFRGPFDPREMEDRLKLIPGVLEDGLFTKKRPVLLIGQTGGGVEQK